MDCESGFDPLRSAGFPDEALPDETAPAADALRTLAAELRGVQKPERLVQHCKQLRVAVYRWKPKG